MFNYFRVLIKNNSGESSKSFSLVLSAIIGGLIGLCVCFVLLWDVITDGMVSTNLADLGIFLLCTGVYMMGGGASKVISESFDSKVREVIENKKEKPKMEEEIVEDLE